MTNNASMEETLRAEVECLRKVLAEKDNEKFSMEKGILNFCMHTPSMALNWSYLKGYLEKKGNINV